MSPAVRTLTLLTPGLLDNAPRTGPPAAPALARLLARSDRDPDPCTDQDLAVLAAFGISVPEDSVAPVAPITRFLDTGMADASCWMRADPVHLAADRDRLLLADATTVPVDRSEADALIRDIGAALAELDGRLEAPAPTRWYLRTDHCPDMSTSPPRAAAGSDAGSFLPSGPDAAHWSALLNEIQMVLHASAVNTEREERGLPAINSLWFWGAGHLPQPRRAPWAGVWSDDPVAAGLAGLARIPAHPLPAGAQAWLAQAGAPGEHLVLVDGIGTAVRQGGAAAWSALLQAFEREWIVPLVAALRARRLDQLRLRPLNGRHYRVDRGALRRFWRRARGLEPHLSETRSSPPAGAAVGGARRATMGTAAP